MHRDLGLLATGGEDGVVRWWGLREVDAADSTDDHPIPGLLPLAELRLPLGCVVRSIVRLSSDARGPPLAVTVPTAHGGGGGSLSARSQSGLGGEAPGEGGHGPSHTASSASLAPAAGSGAPAVAPDDELIAGAPYAATLAAAVDAAWGHGASHSVMVASARTLEVGGGSLAAAAASANSSSMVKIPPAGSRPPLAAPAAAPSASASTGAVAAAAGVLPGGSARAGHHPPHPISSSRHSLVGGGHAQQQHANPPPIVRRVTWLIADASGRVWRAETLAFAALHKRRSGLLVAVPGIRLLDHVRPPCAAAALRMRTRPPFPRCCFRSPPRTTGTGSSESSRRRRRRPRGSRVSGGGSAMGAGRRGGWAGHKR